MSFFIEKLSLSFSHKVCFSDFSAHICFRGRIAIIGRNGSGKSSLLKMIADKTEISAGYVPQIITDYDNYSGGERFNKALTEALSRNPDVLLLDEPTNHLDKNNRRGLFKKLDSFYGTLIIVTHDREILRKYIDILWHINNGKITVFNGKYDNYMSEQLAQRESLRNQIHDLKKRKQDIHESLMREQRKVSKSKASGQKKVHNKKWMKSVGDLKAMKAMKAMKAETSQGSKLQKIDHKKRHLPN